MKKTAFTLIEILIATALTAVLIALLALVNTSASRTWESVEKRSAKLQDLMIVRQSLGKLVSNAVPYHQGKDDSFYNAFEGEANHFRLASLQRITNLEDGGLIFAELSVEDEQLQLNYAFRPWNANSDLELDRTVLLEEVQSLSCRYAYAEEEREIAWCEQWIEEEHDALPLGIEITIEFNNGDQESFLWRTAANSRYERWENLGDMLRDKSPITGARSQ